MDYQTAVTTEFIPRCNAALNSVAQALIAAGLPASGVTVSMPDSQDLRFAITAKRGSKTFTGYIELTDGIHLGQSGGQALFTLWADVNGTEMTTSYAPGTVKPYITDGGVDELLAKLTELEGVIPSLIVKIRAALGL